MTERIRAAAMEDFEALCRFYEEVCAAQAAEEYGPEWHYGIYPSAEDLREHLARRELYLAAEEGRIASAMVLTDREDKAYEKVRWALPAEPEEVCALHLFAVHPYFRGTGLSRAMMDAMLRIAREAGKKAIHLDVVKGNLPAEKLYQKVGFRFACELPVYYEDTGDILVRLYEYDLSRGARQDG